MFAPRSIKHCRACGGEVRYQTPADDNRDRATCTVCTTIHYENPLNVVRVGQVHLFYRARMLDIDFVPGPESLEARLFTEAEVPWHEMAFRTSKMTLEFFFADRRAGRFAFHAADIT